MAGLATADYDIMRALREAPDGLTCEEIEGRTKRSHQSISANLSRLRRLQKVKKTGDRRKNSRNRSVAVYALGAELLYVGSGRSNKRKAPVKTVLLLPGQYGDPEAWKGYIGQAAILDRTILECLQAGGKFGRTCEEIETRIERSHQSVSGQLKRLVDRGFVVHNGVIGRTRSGRPAMRWIINPRIRPVHAIERAKVPALPGVRSKPDPTRKSRATKMLQLPAPSAASCV